MATESLLRVVYAADDQFFRLVRERVWESSELPWFAIHFRQWGHDRNETGTVICQSRYPTAGQISLQYNGNDWLEFNGSRFTLLSHIIEIAWLPNYPSAQFRPDPNAEWFREVVEQHGQSLES